MDTSITTNLPSCGVSAKLNPFLDELEHQVLPAGQTITRMVQEVIRDEHVYGVLVVEIGGTRIAPEHWEYVRPKAGVELSVYAVPQNSDNLRMLATVAVVVAAAWVSFGATIPGSGALITGSTLGVSYASMAGTAVAVGGMLAVSTLFPIAQNQFEKNDQSVSLQVTNPRNQERPFAPIPMILGFVRFTPHLVASPFVTIEGQQQFVTMLASAGYGPVEIYNHRYGDEPVSNFPNVKIQVRYGYLDDTPITLYPGLVEQDVIATRIYNGYWDCTETHPEPNPTPPNSYIHTTAIACKRFVVVIGFPHGLIRIKDQGTHETQSVLVEITYRKQGDVDWILGEAPTYTDKTSAVFFKEVEVDPGVATEEIYEVQFRRMTRDDCEGLDPDGDNTRFSATVWQTLTAYSDADPVNTDLCMSYVAIKSQSGMSDQYNHDARTIALDYDYVTDTWIKRPTNNPASLYRFALQGQANRKAVKDCRVDIPMLQDFHTFCRVNDFTFNQVRDARSVVELTIKDIVAAGRGRVTGRNGKWSVIYDNPDFYINPAQTFFQRNVNGFSISRLFPDVAHGLDVRYVDRDDGSKQKSLIRYNTAEGYNENNAWNLEGASFTGVTSQLENEKMADWALAVSNTRGELFVFKADIEYLVCRSGSAVLLQHNAILADTGSARIRSIAGNQVTLDTVFTLPATPAMQLRSSNTRDLEYRTIAEVEGTKTNVVTLVEGMPESTAVGDLVGIGIGGEVTLKVVVDSLQPHANGLATLRCYDYAPETAVGLV